MMRTILLMVFMLMFASVSFAETGVNRIAIAEDIEEREPVGASNSFKASIAKLYCFTEIVTDNYPTEVVHIWSYEGDIVAEVPLRVGSPKWRTYSSKNIPESAKGMWKVDIYATDNNETSKNLIGNIEFEVE